MINSNESTTSNTRSSQPFMPVTQAMSAKTDSRKSSDNKIKNPRRDKGKSRGHGKNTSQTAHYYQPSIPECIDIH